MWRRAIQIDRAVLALLFGLALAVLAIATGCDGNQTPPAGPDAGGVTFNCLPNLDGRIDADELPVSLELPVDYFVSPDGTQVDLAGATDEGGRRVWDFAAESAADQRITVQAEPLAGRWYAADFPGGQFVVPALAPGDADGIYARDDAGLWLFGLASPEPDPPGGRTLLVYDDPVALLTFPLAPGDAWTDRGTITGGTLNGLPYNGTDTYQVEVDALGRMELPLVSFSQAHRVRTRVEVAPAAGGVTTSRRQVSFFFECFGEVARAVSRPDEPNRDFQTAAELRRFAL
jgi:hypothetical protein